LRSTQPSAEREYTKVAAKIPNPWEMTGSWLNQITSRGEYATLLN